MGTVRTPMRLVGAYADPAKIESLLGGTKFNLMRNTTVLADPFTDNSFDAAKWNRTQVGTGTVLEQNNRLEIKGSGTWHQAAVVSVNTYTGTGDVLIEMKVSRSAVSSFMFGLSTSSTPSYVGAFFYVSGAIIYGFSAGAFWPNNTMAFPADANVYTLRFRRDMGAGYVLLTIQGGAYTVETTVSRLPWTWTTPFYIHFQNHTSTSTLYVTDFVFYDNGGYDSSSPPIYSVMDSGVAASTWDMSTFTDRGDNVNGETGSVKYKYFFSDTLYDPTNAGDRATIIAGLSANWQTEAQIQGEADQTGRYRYLAEQLISDGTQTCSEVEAADLQDVILPAAAGGGGASVF